MDNIHNTDEKAIKKLATSIISSCIKEISIKSKYYLLEIEWIKGSKYNTAISFEDVCEIANLDSRVIKEKIEFIIKEKIL